MLKWGWLSRLWLAPVKVVLPHRLHAGARRSLIVYSELTVIAGLFWLMLQCALVTMNDRLVQRLWKYIFILCYYTFSILISLSCIRRTIAALTVRTMETSYGIKLSISPQYLTKLSNCQQKPLPMLHFFIGRR